MRRKEDFPLQKVTLSLYDGDWDYIRSLYSQIGASRVIRKLVRNFREKVEKGAKQGVITVDVDSIDL